MGSFQSDTALADRDGRLTATLSRAWEIWGPNGGYVATIALRAAGARAPEGHRPATISVQYLRVAKFEPIEAVVETVRAGRSAACLHVRLMQDGAPFLAAQVWTTNKSEGVRVSQARFPDVPLPDALKPIQDYLSAEELGRGPPPFWTHFESRPIAFTPWDEASPLGHVAREWERHKDWTPTDDPFLDCGRTLVLLDTVPWIAHCQGLAGRRPYIAPSLDVSVWFHEVPGAADWLLMDARSDTAGGGLIHGSGMMWSQDGCLLATGASHLLQTPLREG